MPYPSNAPRINPGAVTRARQPMQVPQMQSQSQGMNPLQMAQMYKNVQGLFGGGAGAAQAPGLQASGATTAGLTGAQAAPLATATPLPAAGGAGATAFPVAGAGIGGALFAGNEYLAGKHGMRDDFKDYLTAWGTGTYSDVYGYAEEPMLKARDELYTPIESGVSDAWSGIENFFSNLF